MNRGHRNRSIKGLKEEKDLHLKAGTQQSLARVYVNKRASGCVGETSGERPRMRMASESARQSSGESERSESESGSGNENSGGSRNQEAGS
eukprot:6212583-Pleurochrysis_carterae.AAC.1